jgi:hypothetical protein
MDAQVILKYYREQVEAHEKDRKAYLEKMDMLRVKQAEAHRVEWELKKRGDEREELKGALMKCTETLMAERAQVEGLTGGGDDLKVQQEVNKQHILALLEKSNSVEQHIYYQKDESPEKIQQYYLGNGGQGIVGGQHATGPLTKPKIVQARSTLAYKPKMKPNILRTIYMPNHEVDEGSDQIKALRGTIDKEKEYYDDLMHGMHDEKAQFEENLRSRYLELEDKYTGSLQALHDKERYNQEVVRDHVELKHVFELEERAAQEENEAVRQENMALRNAIRGICKDTRTTVDGARNEFEMNAEEFAQRFREQTSTHNVNMSLIRDQYNKVSEMHKRKVTTKEEKRDRDFKKLEQVSTKRQLDLEGNMADLQNLEKRMVFYQNYIGKLKKLVDKDQLLQQQLEAQELGEYVDETDVIQEEAAEE